MSKPGGLLDFSPTFVTQKQRGAGLLEFTLVVVIVGILTTVLLHRISQHERDAEVSAMRTVIASLRTALEIKVVHVKLPCGMINLTILAEENLFDWLKDKPRNCAGAYFFPCDVDMGAGKWRFDRTDKLAIYLLNISTEILDASTKRL